MGSRPITWQNATDAGYSILGMHLRDMRQRRGLGLDRVVLRGRLMSMSTLARLERGETRTRPEKIRTLMTVYSPSEVERADVEALTGGIIQADNRGVFRDAGPGRWDRLAAIARRAESIREYGTHHVPAAAQTDEYTTALNTAFPQMRGREDIARMLTGRYGEPSELVLEESVLLRPVGGAIPMMRQLVRLLNLVLLLSELSRPVKVGIVPDTTGSNVAALGPYRLLESQQPVVVRVRPDHVGYWPAPEHAETAREGLAAATDPTTSAKLIRAAIRHHGGMP